MMYMAQSLVVIALAELGDKTQFASMGLSARYSAMTVLVGSAVAILLVQLASVGLGQLSGALMPTDWLVPVGAALFVALGLAAARRAPETSNAPARVKGMAPVLTVIATIVVAELGDKSMMATAALAAASDSPLQVWLGSSMGMFIGTVAAVGVARVAGRFVSERTLRLVSAVAFLTTGMLMLAGWVAESSTVAAMVAAH
jgi:putative Ca2+/H+ antiporter (TMEM165/GDT1 family)